MRITGIDLNLLPALHALLAERNVTRAGHRVGLSQPAMSEALARLRRHFGDDLLTRIGNRYELTPFGASLRASSAAAMELVEQTFAAAQGFDPGTCGREFVLLASDHAAVLLGPLLSAAIRAEAPRARLRLARLPATEPAGTANGEARGVDGFVLPRSVGLAGFPGLSLFRDRWVCVVSADNPVVGSPLTVETMARLPWVVHELLEGHDPVLSSVSTHGLTPDIELVVGDFLLVPGMVRGTGRIGLVPEKLFDRRAVLGTDGLRILEPPFQLPPIVETLCWHPAHTHDPAHRWLRGLAVAAGRAV